MIVEREYWGLNTTKLHQPSVTAHLVTRPRLVEHLVRGLDLPLTLVCASAGYGKTTLVSAWLKELAVAKNKTSTPLRTAWLSLDEHDNDLAIFVRYFCAAIRTAFPKACSQTLALLDAPQSAPLDAFVVSLSNELDGLPQPCVLVLDDFHLISSVDIADLLSGMLKHWPHSLRLVLITRRNPSLPLPSLRARGRLSEIRTRDLRFTPYEIGQYVKQVSGEELSSSLLAQIENQTEGWITGLYLATVALGREVGGDRSTGPVVGRQNISDYLISELLAGQSPDIERFLLQTALVDRFCVPLCEHVVEMNPTDRDPSSCLEWLERTNFLMTALGSEPVWYRYHHLMRDELRRRAAHVLGEQSVRDVHRRAASWFAQQGLIEEALQQALEAGDREWAARMMEGGVREVLNREDRPMVERWVRLLPAEFRRSRPGLLMLEAWLMYYSWRIGDTIQVVREVEQLLEQNVGGLSSEEQRILNGQILALRAQVAHLHNQAGASIEYAEEGLELLPRSWIFVRGLHMLYRGESLQSIGQAESADRELWEQYQAAPNKTDGYALRMLFALCANKAQSGDLENARQMAMLMRQQASRSTLVTMEGWADLWLGVVHYQWNELETAAQHFEAIAERRYSVHTACARPGLYGLVMTRLARGELDAAEQALDLLSRYDIEMLAYETQETLAARAQVCLLRGDTASAWRWADAFTTPVPDRALYGLENAYLVRARLLLARGGATDIQTAQHVTDAVYNVAVRSHNTRFQIALLAIRAVAFAAQQQDDAALASLQHAVELARPGGFIRAFVDLGAPMQALLRRLPDQGMALDTVDHILAAFPIAKPEGPPRLHPPYSAALVEPLTTRELEVLVLLRERWSNKEIAQELVITLVTVKRHIANLYGKLGVNKRLAAVARAEDLGILPRR